VHYRTGQAAAQRLTPMLAALSEISTTTDDGSSAEICHRAIIQDGQADVRGYGLVDFYSLIFKSSDAPYGTMANVTAWKPTNVTGKASNQPWAAAIDARSRLGAPAPRRPGTDTCKSIPLSCRCPRDLGALRRASSRPWLRGPTAFGQHERPGVSTSGAFVLPKRSRALQPRPG